MKFSASRTFRSFSSHRGRLERQRGSGSGWRFRRERIWKPHQLSQFSSIRAIDADAGSVARFDVARDGGRERKNPAALSSPLN
jgi:hypothetical protein